MQILTIWYRNDLNLGVLCHYYTNFTFLCVVKNEETDSLGLLGQNQDDSQEKQTVRRTDRVAFNTWLILHCIKSINIQS